MPGWHVKTKELEKAGKLAVLGITQEQHPARTALFMQWQELKWPVLLDSLNLLECKGIPFTLLLDEHGVVRYQNPKDEELTTFLETNYPKPDKPANKTVFPSKDSTEGRLMWGKAEQLDTVIGDFKAQIKDTPSEGTTHFRLGVAYRKRYDSEYRKEGDFLQAVASWKEGLRLVPSQYIWRRRIQQYGPRLDKPYSFYDWVHQAREEIKERGETPHPLLTEPTGAEFAYPEKEAANAALAEHPDPKHQVPIDTEDFIQLEAVAVASTDAKRPAYRVHLTFTPNKMHKVHWTNDAGPLTFFPEPEKSDTEIVHLQVSAPPHEAASNETRHVEFEVRGELPKTLTGNAYFYVCEDTDGTCLFLRKPVKVTLD